MDTQIKQSTQRFNNFYPTSKKKYYRATNIFQTAIRPQVCRYTNLPTIIMEDQLYQNIDTPQTNPRTQSPVTTPRVPVSKKLLDFHDTKIIILTILGSILIILVIAAIVMSLIRSSKPQSVTLPTMT
jgi:hypothetical protein